MHQAPLTSHEVIHPLLIWLYPQADHTPQGFCQLGARHGREQLLDASMKAHTRMCMNAHIWTRGSMAMIVVPKAAGDRHGGTGDRHGGTGDRHGGTDMVGQTWWDR